MTDQLPHRTAGAEPAPATETQPLDRAALTGVVASAAKNYFEPVFDGLLRPHDDTLLTRGSGKGLWIYDELERDCHVYAVMQKRKMSVIGREWQLDPASDSTADKAAADGIRTMLESLPFDRICLQLLDAILKGFAVGEVIWAPQDNYMAPVQILGRDQRRFVMDEYGRARLLTLAEPVYGEALPAMKFIVHRFGSKDNNPYGLGLGTRLFWPAWFKRQGVQFWLTFADKFGNPTIWGTYAPGSTAAQKQTLLDAMSAASSDAGIAVPSGMDLKLLETARSAGAGGTYDTLMAFLNEEISVAVLGETMSTSARQGSGLGSSQAAVQNEVRLELTKADADLLADTLNSTLIRWCTTLNFPSAQPPCLYWDVSEPQDTKAMADRDQVLSQMGYRLTPDAVKELYGDYYADNGAFAGAPLMSPDISPVALAQARVSPALQLTENLESRSKTALKPLFDPILALVEHADSLEEIRDGLTQLYPDMNADRLATLMRDGMATAYLAGRFEVDEGR